MTTDIESELYTDMDTIAELATSPSDPEDALRQIRHIARSWEDPS